MDRSFASPHRRGVLLGLGCLALSAVLPGTARAQNLGRTLSNLLSQAAESSLDKLARPGAFYDDPAIRIGLPLPGGGLGKGIGSALDVARQLGLTESFVRHLNDAAGEAASQAKPVFRSAIGKLRLGDVPGIAAQRDGATQYLRTSASEDLQKRLRPVVDKALMRAGAFSQLDRITPNSPLLRNAGITRDRLGVSVTEQALKGMFEYIGAEEGRLRADPLGAAAGLLKGVTGS